VDYSIQASLNGLCVGLEGGDEVYRHWLVVHSGWCSAFHTQCLESIQPTHALAGVLCTRDLSQNILDWRMRNGMEFSRVLDSLIPVPADKANPKLSELNRVHDGL
jgi:hypothetical protein